MTINKRHLAKTITWRLVGSLDTFILSYILIGSINIGIKIAFIEIFTKMALYYYHEKIWFKSNIFISYKRHLFKTFSWRLIATLDTIILGYVFTSNPIAAFTLGGAELVTKMFLYYGHERIWYKINFGLEDIRKIFKS